MNPNSAKKAHLLMAVTITLMILITSYFIMGEISRYPIDIIWFALPIWAAREVEKRQFNEYRISYPYGSVGTFFFVFFLFPIAFPWFLSSWFDVVRGTSRKRKDPPEELSPLVSNLLKK